jgi:hypothetical protein
MRNTTKLKHLLIKYTATFNLEDEGLFQLIIHDKFKSNKNAIFEGASYASVLDKAYRYMMKEIKTGESDDFSDE